MPLPFYTYIEIDNRKYVVASETYDMKWARAFSSQLAGNIVRLNFIDRGPGIRVYDATLILNTWDADSIPYRDGITDTWDVQMQNLQNSFSQIATVLQFQDPFGQAAGSEGDGVYFTSYELTIPKYATPQKPTVLAIVELTEATQVVA